MKEINISGLNEKYYYEKLDNGLKVYLMPNEKANNFYMTYNVHFGSIDTEFKNNNSSKYYKVPNGIAHYLEHLMFYESDGTTAHENFSKWGSMINAATSFRSTFYEVSSSTHFKENLEYLLRYVNSPYFTKENVSGEKGIITEEIKMGDDNPYLQLFFGNRNNIYHKSHLKYLVSGKVPDIKKITADDVNLCYESFYHPENMFVIITGKFNPYEAIGIIKEVQKEFDFKEFLAPKRKKILEPEKVVQAYEEIEMDVEISKVCFSIKTAFRKFKNIDEILVVIYLNLFLNIKFGKTSLLNEKLIKNNLITDTISKSVNSSEDGVILTLTFDSLYPEEALDLIKKEFTDLKILQEELERKKRVAISSFVMSFDDIYEVHESFQNDIFKYGKYIDNIYDIYANLSLDELNKILENIKFDNTSTFVIKPTKKSS